MSKNFRIAFLLFVCLAAALPAGGKKDNSLAEESQTVQEGTPVKITGRVRLVGSDPLPSLVITGEKHEWYIASEDRQILHDLQQRTVTVEGTETIRALKWANGKSAGTRRYLSNIKIISVE